YFIMTGCSRQAEDMIDLSETADLNEISVATQIKEIPVDFPFRESQHYSLTLALIDESNSKYELRLYGNNKRLLQQIPCGTLTEPIQFSYDDLTYGVYSGLEIFPAEQTTGLFFTWKDERFSENAIEIPKYTEVRGTAMLAVSDEATSQVRKIYQYNRYQNRIDELRRWQLQKDTRFLEIWDYLEKQKLFEGTIMLDDKGSPANKEYYDLLLWDDLYLPGDLGDTSDEKTINTWIDEPNIQSAELFGNDIQMGECESREALLSAFGFEDSTPMYQYFDHFHNLRLELYKNALTEQFCGIAHEYVYNNEWKKSEVMYGFILNEVQESEWSGDTAFSLKAVDGTDGAHFVDEYEEIIEYTPAGNPDYFRSQGMMEQEEDG
ncbi:MAG: hypothetical protein K2M91_06900, partial [Lachnospiraceae bacterium]|nr:hypothetical protein [Lachnospiraceae bacterium]